MLLSSSLTRSNIESKSIIFYLKPSILHLILKKKDILKSKELKKFCDSHNNSRCLIVIIMMESQTAIRL